MGDIFGLACVFKVSSLVVEWLYVDFDILNAVCDFNMLDLQVSSVWTTFAICDIFRTSASAIR